MPTNKRELRLVISAVLKSKGIDDLAIEGHITDAVCKFLEETKRGRDAVKTRQSIVDGILHYNDVIRGYEVMSERIEKAVRVKPDGSDNWNMVIKHCIEQEPGQSIEQYGEWMIADPFNSPKIHQIAQNPRLIISTWPAAFSGISSGRKVYLPPTTAVFAED